MSSNQNNMVSKVQNVLPKVQNVLPKVQNVLPKVQNVLPKVQTLCIPKVNFETTKNDIFKTFNKINIVELERVDIICKKSQKGENYKMVFLHFNKWYNTDIAENAKDRILSGKDIKVVYAFPWFWKITANRRDLNK
jgi:hypothetical protein